MKKIAGVLLMFIMAEPVMNEWIEITFVDGRTPAVIRVNYCEKKPEIDTLVCYYAMSDREIPVAAFHLHEVKRIGSKAKRS